jgi:hypothetical protein
VCAYPSITIDTIGLLTSNPGSIVFKRQQNESYAESKELLNWIQNSLDPAKCDQIRQQLNDFTNFLIVYKENRKAQAISFK